MADVVTVGEGHICAGVHGQHMGHELLVALVHVSLGGNRTLARRALQRQHGIHHRLALLVKHLCLKGRGSRQRTEHHTTRKGGQLGINVRHCKAPDKS